MKKRRLFVAVAIFTIVLVFFCCDLLLPPPEEEEPETYSDLVIKGKDKDNKIVVITFSTTRPVGKATQMPFPKDGDNYKIQLGNIVVSDGDVKMNSTNSVVNFFPKDGSTSFNAAFDSEKKSLKFDGDRIPSNPAIDGYKSDTETSVVNPTAKEIALQLDKDEKNATPDGDNVMITGPITLEKDVEIPDSIKLLFNSRNNDSWTIKSTTASNFSIIARGGIEVRDSRGVKLDSSVSLTVEGDSTINGRLIVDGGATLDIAGNVTIESRGVLELAGNDTADKVSTAKYGATYIPTGSDAVFKLRGTLTVRYGGRFQMPDPLYFFKNSKDNDITGTIKVESGGELVLFTSDPNGNTDLHPLIGTLSTATQGAPVGADFVMDPDAYPNHKDSKIEAKISSKTFALELTGDAIALGRLILDEKYNVNIINDDRKPPYRLEVWLTYPFTVTPDGNLLVGISEELKLRSSLLVTGMSYPMKSIPGIEYKGVLTNNGKIFVYTGNGIMEWFGGYFDHNENVIGTAKIPATSGNLNYANYYTKESNGYDPEWVTIVVKVWSPEWPGTLGTGGWWYPWFIK